jgi:predicted Zn-ribbon and HTH transcriptional regulator
MDEQALRAMVREAVARQVQGAQAAAPAERPVTFAAHVSHIRYALPKSDGPCLIEPAVQCNHCGYCESHGH